MELVCFVYLEQHGHKVYSNKNRVDELNLILPFKQISCKGIDILIL